MEQALEQYGKKSTTIGQMRQNISDFKSPIYVACVDPPFKKSFFRNNGVSETSGAIKYFWMFSPYQKLLENTTYSAMDNYMNMTYQLGSDWNINLLYLNGLVYASIFLTKKYFIKKDTIKLSLILHKHLYFEFVSFLQNLSRYDPISNWGT